MLFCDRFQTSLNIKVFDKKVPNESILQFQIIVPPPCLLILDHFLFGPPPHPPPFPSLLISKICFADFLEIV